MADSKEVAQKFLEDQVAKAIEWLKDENNREMVLKYGFMIAQAVLNKKIQKRNNYNMEPSAFLDAEGFLYPYNITICCHLPNRP